MGIVDFASEMRRKAEEAEKAEVRIAFFGQPGAGKSSLINQIIGKDIATVGVATDVTRVVERYEHNGLVLCDLPGYGTARFPADTFISQFDVLGFDVIICVSASKFSRDDTEFYRLLLAEGKRCIFVRNKADTLFQRGKSQNELKADIVADLVAQAGTKLDVIFTSCATGEGLSELDDTITSQLEGTKRDRFFRSAEAHSTSFLNGKRESCKRYATLFAGGAAAANLIPAPGVGIAADLSTIAGLLAAVRRDFGLNDGKLVALEAMVPALAPIIGNVIKYASTDGVRFLLKQFGGRVVKQQMASYVPLVGPVIAASLSFGTVKLAADSYIDDCYAAAAAILKAQLQRMG